MKGKAPVEKTYTAFQEKSVLPLSDAPASRDTQPIADEENAFPAEESSVIEKGESVLPNAEHSTGKSDFRTGKKKPSSVSLHFGDSPSHRSKKSDVGKEKKKPIQKVSEAMKPIARRLRLRLPQNPRKSPLAEQSRKRTSPWLSPMRRW